MTIQDLEQARKDAVAKARASGLQEDHIAAKQAGLALAATIVDGCKLCECGAMPHGMLQPFLFGKDVMTGFEIGCTSCKGKRCKAPTREGAVAKWNEDQWLSK